MHRNAQLPPRCVKSNAPADGWLTRKLHWYHPAILLAILVNLIVFVVLAVVLGKSATIQVGLTREWFVRRRWRIAIAWTLALLGVALLIAGIALVDEHDWAGWMLLASPFVLIAAAVYGLVAARIVWPARITTSYVVLNGVHPAYLAELPEWPYPAGYFPP